MTTIHVAGPPQAGGLYQECARCGHVLQDYTGRQIMVPEGQADLGISTWSTGKRIAIDDDGVPRMTWALADDAPLEDDETECRPTS